MMWPGRYRIDFVIYELSWGKAGPDNKAYAFLQLTELGRVSGGKAYRLCRSAVREARSLNQFSELSQSLQSPRSDPSYYGKYEVVDTRERAR